MDQKKTALEVESFIRKLKVFLVVFTLVFVIPLVIYVFYAEKRLSTAEDGLRYRGPIVGSDVDMHLDEISWKPAQGQTIYVPAYSHIYHQDGKPQLLTVTLSIRNTDTIQEIVLTSVRYYDTNGKEVKSYLETPLRVGPLATKEFLIERDDVSGGSGANFLVEWVSKEKVSSPILETLMVDTSGNQGISFVCAGKVVKEINFQPDED